MSNIIITSVIPDYFSSLVSNLVAIMEQELLSSNIDGLFEKMNLEEIQQVLRKMRQEIEKKREDLRVTVG